MGTLVDEESNEDNLNKGQGQRQRPNSYITNVHHSNPANNISNFCDNFELLLQSTLKNNYLLSNLSQTQINEIKHQIIHKKKQIEKIKDTRNKRFHDHRYETLEKLSFHLEEKIINFEYLNYGGGVFTFVPLEKSENRLPIMV